MATVKFETSGKVIFDLQVWHRASGTRILVNAEGVAKGVPSGAKGDNVLTYAVLAGQKKKVHFTIAAISGATMDPVDRDTRENGAGSGVRELTVA